jgi:nucleotide-binding universal stress UspA family protein
MTFVNGPDHDASGTPCPRILVAVHGYEPGEWSAEACRLVSLWNAPSVRLLAVLDVPAPAFTSLTASARHAYHAARLAWSEREILRLRPLIDAMLKRLPDSTDVVHAAAAQGDPARTIVERAADWAADVIVMGAPAPGPRSWLWPGPLHERVLRGATRAVLVTAPPATRSRRPARLPALPRVRRLNSRPLAAEPGT